MSRYYSDSDDASYAFGRQPDSIRASGWQSPLPTVNETPLSSSVTRIIVEPPFGSKKCDYTIDKSEPGRLIVTARRRQIFSSDYLSLNNKNNIAIQTFTIPSDADVDRLQSHIERSTNRLIIEIPRTRPANINTYTASPDILKSSGGVSKLIQRKNMDNNRKVEYRIDCHGYTADELEVFIEGRDLIVQGKTKRSTSSDSAQQRSSKQFSRKISLPNTVDLSKVISYLENGELRIEAPLKREIYYDDEEIYSPKLTSTAVSRRMVGGYNRVQSPIPGNHRRHYRRRERISRAQPTSTIRRVRSVDALNYPLYRSPRDFDVEDDDEDNRYRRTVNYERYRSNRNNIEQQPIYRSVYEPPSNLVTTRTTYHTYPRDNDVYFKY
jgi:virulence-associated protein VagC